MAEVIPFRGLFFNPDKTLNLADLITPPFDVISKHQQDRFYKSSPYNVIRLILGKKTGFDTRKNNPHTRAADYLNQWLAERILVRDEQPTFYFTSLEFPLGGENITRYGLIACVRLEPFQKGIILPHEKTFTKVKSERLELMQACKTNFSPIFSLYADENSIFQRLQTAVVGRNPDIHFRDAAGCKHSLWRVTDTGVHRHVADALRPRRLYIADGHHRYETALNYRDWLAGSAGELDAQHPANYVIMYLCGMNDPGLVILPAHRLIKEVDKAVLEGMLPRAAEYFDIREYPYSEDRRQSVLDSLLDALRANAGGRSLGVAVKAKRSFYLFILRPGVMSGRFGADIAAPLRELDVTALTRLIFMEILGFDQARLDNEKLIDYTVDARAAAAAVHNGEADAAFILNPTNVEQICKIARQGLVMPRKATYFYPKVTTGLVFNQLVE